MDGGLEIRDDLKHHETYWRVQRFGWFCMGLIVVAAIAGLFARGPLAEAQVSAGKVRLEYARFARVTAAESLTLKIDPPHASDRVSVSIPRSYLQYFEVSGVYPEPESVTAAGRHLVYMFRTEPSSTFEVSMQLEAQPGAFGRIRGEVQSGGTTLYFWQFFWP